MVLLPPAVNYHINRACNARCRFCFATFRDSGAGLPRLASLELIDALRDAGAEKLNFAGGEPTLHPGLGGMVSHAKRSGLVTSLITNGFRLEKLLDENARDLDWVGLSVDSGREEIEQELGRSSGDHVARSIVLADMARAKGVHVKLNTVVTAMNVDEDVSGLVRRVRPERWKIFRVLPMGGQNDGVEPLLVTAQQFQAFVARHQHLALEGYPPVAEDNDDMRGSYAMVDPLGRFYGNSTGRHVYSRPILEVGVEAALVDVGFEMDRFLARGGRYSW